MENKPILETILKNRQANELTKFNPAFLVSSLFKVLSDREQEVLKKRHALDGHAKYTLERIGQDLNVTRERVRQIELAAIRKLKALPEFEAQVNPAEKVVNYVLESHGGLMEHQHLLENLLEYSGDSHTHKSSASFVLSQLLSDRFHFIENHDHLHPSWKVVSASENDAMATVNHLVNVIESKSEPVPHSLLLSALADKGHNLEERVVLARLRASKKIKNNVFGHWGLASWNTITPKRMNDKIFLVLKEHGKPLHFTDIAKRINEMKFDAKVAYPATVHNELILDKKYVLVGRGIYALADWGYKKGVVADVICDIMNSAGRPMSRDEIVEAVLKQRMVGKTTIHLALMNKSRFTRTPEGKFVVAQNLSENLAGQKTEVA
ncbi:hypothetical protein HY224_00525 [Candidatus Uhrbacteria bacterium]|nr:hypothetical protein [Candidatus Uhrbacteria bacterium]